ncbi:MAG: hypothetical protein SynsKO_38280 [Synoicihabitans sp.]
MNFNRISVLFISLALHVHSESDHQFSTGIIDYGVVVRNVDKSVEFYESIGMSKLTSFSVPASMSGDAGLTDYKELQVVMMTATGGETDSKIKLIQLPGTPKRQDQTYIDSTYGMSYQTLFVEDIAATVDMLTENGIKILAKGPTDLSGAGFEGIFILLVKDPDGNFVEFVGPKK